VGCARVGRNDLHGAHNMLVGERGDRCFFFEGGELEVGCMKVMNLRMKVQVLSGARQGV
jgi:hypothetical protein